MKIDTTNKNGERVVPVRDHLVELYGTISRLTLLN